MRIGDIAAHPAVIARFRDDFAQRAVAFESEQNTLVVFQEGGEQGGAGQSSAESGGR
ncbi:MAG: hypothetical protein ACD_75C00235G0001, partial [uncultured bacterium]